MNDFDEALFFYDKNPSAVVTGMGEMYRTVVVARDSLPMPRRARTLVAFVSFGGASGALSLQWRFGEMGRCRLTREPQ